MRLLSLAVVPVALTIASASLGAGWESGMVEDEGGSVMMAWVYGTGGDVPPELRMMCGDQVNLRYGQGTGPGEGVEPIRDPVNVTFDFGDDMIKRFDAGKDKIDLSQTGLGIEDVEVGHDHGDTVITVNNGVGVEGTITIDKVSGGKTVDDGDFLF